MKDHIDLVGRLFTGIHLTLDYYISAGEQNNTNLSRTIRTGKVEEGVSKDKPASKIAAGEDLREKAIGNYKTAVSFAFLRKDRTLNDEIESGDFIRNSIWILNEGIIDQGVSILRTHEIPPEKGYGCPTKQLPESFDRFCRWYADATQQPMTDHKLSEYCAMTEKIVDKDAHFFKDGCGRISRLLSMFLCMRNNAPVRLHKERERHYDRMDPKAPLESLFEPESAMKWIEHYRGLPLIL